MRRPVWFRALTALWALWFAVALIEPAGIHQCPVHGSVAASDMGGMAGMAGMDMGGMAMSHDAAQPGDGSHHAAQCTCLSQCCSAPVFVPPARTALPEHAIAAASPARFADVTAPLLERAHVLPYANGPPPRPLAST